MKNGYNNTWHTLVFVKIENKFLKIFFDLLFELFKKPHTLTIKVRLGTCITLPYLNSKDMYHTPLSQLSGQYYRQSILDKNSPIGIGLILTV